MSGPTESGAMPGVSGGAAQRMVRLQLAQLVEVHGDVILDDARLVRAMLSDSVPTARREINLINVMLAAGVAERLRAAGRDPLRVQAELDQLTRQLERETALHPDAAAWAVRACAWAMHLAPAPDQFEVGAQPGGATAPAQSRVPAADPASASRPPWMQEPVAVPTPPAAPAPGPGGVPSVGVPPVASPPAGARSPWRRVALIYGLAAVAVVVAIGIAAAVIVWRNSASDSGAQAGPSPTPSSLSTAIGPTPTATTATALPTPTGSASAGATSRAFSFAQQRLIESLTKAASAEWCVEMTPDHLLCDIPLDKTHSVDVVYTGASTQEVANARVNAEARSVKAVVGTWTTPTGAAGGRSAQWVDTYGHAMFEWSLAIYSSSFTGLATWESNDQQALYRWWQNHSIAQP